MGEWPLVERMEVYGRTSFKGMGAWERGMG